MECYILWTFAKKRKRKKKKKIPKTSSRDFWLLHLCKFVFVYPPSLFFEISNILLESTGVLPP
jgi:hypothetical protein